MTTKRLGSSPESGGHKIGMTVFDVRERQVTVDWVFTDIETRYRMMPRKPPPVGTLGLFIPTQKVEIVIDLFPFNYVGRSYPYSDNFDGIDFSPFNAYQLGVSRQHVILIQEARYLLLIDNNSMNGTYLNQMMLQPYQPYYLEHNDTIRMGGFEFTVRLS